MKYELTSLHEMSAGLLAKAAYKASNSFVQNKNIASNPQSSDNERRLANMAVVRKERQANKFANAAENKLGNKPITTANPSAYNTARNINTSRMTMGNAQNKDYKTIRLSK